MKRKNRQDTGQQSKILVRFELLPENKQELKKFLDKYSHDFTDGDLYKKTQAQKRLKNLILKTFPEEALDELAKILKGESDCALLIKTGVERDYPSSIAEFNYSYHIGCALYEMCNNKLSHTAILERQSHIDKGKKLYSYYIHRDMVDGGENVILTCPRNDEHAKTEVIRIQKVLEKISQRHLQSKVLLNYRDSKPKEFISLSELQNILKNRRKGRIDFSQCNDWEPEARQSFEGAVANNSEKIDLQPGDLLVFNEHFIFHRAHPGKEEMILNISDQQSNSRLVTHLGGAPNLY